MNKSIRKLAAVVCGCMFLSCLGKISAFADSEEPEPMEEPLGQEIHVEIRWEENRGQIDSVSTLYWDPESLCYQKGTPRLDTENQTPTEIVLTMESKTEAVVGYQITFTPAEGVGIQEKTECPKEGMLTPVDPYQVYQSKVYVTELPDTNPGTVNLGSYSIQLQSVEASAFFEAAHEEMPAEEVSSEETPSEEMLVEEQPNEDDLPEEQPPEEQPAEEQPPEEEPPEEQPPEEQPPEEQPAEEQPPEEEPPEEQPIEEEPAEEQPPEEMPNADQSA